MPDQELEEIRVTAHLGNPGVNDIVERLRGLPETPQITLDLVVVAAVLFHELGGAPGGFQELVDAAQETLSSGGMDV